MKWCDPSLRVYAYRRALTLSDTQIVVPFDQIAPGLALLASEISFAGSLAKASGVAVADSACHVSRHATAINTDTAIVRVRAGTFVLIIRRR